MRVAQPGRLLRKTRMATPADVFLDGRPRCLHKIYSLPQLGSPPVLFTGRSLPVEDRLDPSGSGNKLTTVCDDGWIILETSQQLQVSRDGLPIAQNLAYICSHRYTGWQAKGVRSTSTILGLSTSSLANGAVLMLSLPGSKRLCLTLLVHAFAPIPTMATARSNASLARYYSINKARGIWV